MGQKAVKDARDLLARYGRNGDSELAHISPSERRLMKAWQGYENINPRTGLPEYFSFKKVLKGVAKAAGAAAGAYFGGPAGAAVGGALATKLTGGSWKSALGTGLLSGISAYGLQQSGAGDYLGIGSLGSGADLLGRTASTAASAAAPAAAGVASAAKGFDLKSLLPVAAIGIGALSGSPKQPKVAKSTAQQDVYTGPDWNDMAKPLDRKYQGYGDDYYTYGQDEGEHEFYDEVNPKGYRSGGIAHFKYGGAGVSEGHGTSGTGPRDKSGPGGKGPDKDTQAKIRDAYNDPSRQFDTPANARTVREIMERGDPTTFEGLKNRIPGPMAGITNVIGGTATPEDAVQLGAQGLGALTGNPLAGPAVSAGIGMGKAVTDVQKMRDLGLLDGKTIDDPAMGRVDVVGGEAYSHGNPAADDRAPNTGGFGGGMTGGHGGGDGAAVLASLTKTFTPPPTAGAPIGAGTPTPAAQPGGATPPAPWRTQRAPEDYYTYGQATPEWEFFNQVNPVTSAATGGKISGPGSGQEDKIPAMLSDGEYVWSAQDVSDLGDGSNDEGVRRLNKMREMVRKQAGRKNHKSIAKPQRGIGALMKEAR